MEFEWLNSQIADEAIELILVFNNKGEILFGNRAAEAKLGYSEENLLKCSMSQIFRQDYPINSNACEVFLNMIEKGNRELVMYRNNNSCFSVNVRVIKTDKADKYIIMAEDITASINKRVRKLKEHEEESGRARSEFTANVTHELRTPVNGIKGHALTLRDELENPQHIKTVDIILHCCDTMLALISDVLDYSKIETGKFTIEEREFDFFELIEKVIATHSVEVSRKELRMNVSIDEHIPRFVIGDELRIGQILNNLLSNAVKFTTVGYVSLVINKAMQINDEVELFFMVKDTGIGISPKEQDKLFQSFSQVDASITRRFGGIGLGLVITKQLVELMHGNIHVESEKGKGSTFSFSIRLKTSKNPEDSQNQTYADWNSYVNEEEINTEGLMQFGEPENKKELKKRMDKLVLSIELGAWEKAELLASTIKALTETADEDIKKHVFRLEMAIRKSNYDKSMAAYQNLKTALTASFGEK